MLVKFFIALFLEYKSAVSREGSLGSSSTVLFPILDPLKPNLLLICVCKYIFKL